MRLFTRLPLAQRRPWIGYAVAVGLSAIATVMRELIDPLLPPGFPFLTYFPALVITAFLFGWRAGALAGVLGLFLSWFLFLPPRGAFAATPGNIYALGLYVFVIAVDLGLIWLAQTAHAALARERLKSQQLAENRQLLFHELQHRVGNNLQMVGSLLALQKHTLGGDAAHAIADAARRVKAIGEIQRDLYSPDGDQILLFDTLEKVCRTAVEASGRGDVRLAMTGERTIAVESERSIPLAVIVGEAVANALEHGLAGRSGTIAVALERQEDAIAVAVQDDGVGLPAGFDPARTKSLGLRLVQALAGQLRGKFDLQPATGGTVARIVVPC